MATSTGHDNTDSQNTSMNNLQSSDGDLSPIENTVNDIVARMAALEEQLATDGCDVADV